MAEPKTRPTTESVEQFLNGIADDQRRKDCIRLVFWRGDVARDTTGLLEGEYPDGRRLAHFSSMKDLTTRKKALAAVLKAQLRNVRQ